MQKNRVLITGGAGFIGSHLAETLLTRGEQVMVVDDESTGRLENLAPVMDSANLTYVKADAADEAVLSEVLADVDRVYHLAAAVGVALIAREPISTIRRNIRPTEVLLELLLRQHRTRGPGSVKFFLASSSEVYGKNHKERWSEDDDLVLGSTSRARWSYGASKAIDEFLALAYWREHRLPVVVGRFFNVVGPRQSGTYGMVLPRFVQAAVRDEPLIVHDDGQQKRCFAHVSDVVAAVLGLSQRPAAYGRVYNIGSAEEVSILELARKVIAAAQSKSSIEMQPYAQAYDADFEDVRRRVPDLSRLHAEIGFEPIYDLDRVIRELVAMEINQQNRGEL